MGRKKPLSQQVVVVAGGSYGLGRAIARAAADRGAKVVVGARTREALDAAVGEVEAAGSEGHAVEVDVARREDVERDLVLLRTGWKSQHTQELKPRGSPDNLFEPMPGDPGAHGRFDGRARESTAWTWLRLHRGLLGAGAGLATMGLLAARSSRFPPWERM